MTAICGISPLPLKINHMKQLFLTMMAVLGISVCSGQTLADILNTQYDNHPVPTVPVEYTLPKLVAKTPFVQLFNSLLLATGQGVFHSDEYEADEYILVNIKADDRQIELYGVLYRYPHRPNLPIGWMPWQGKTIIFNGDNPGLFTPLEETRYFHYMDYPGNSLHHLEDDDDPTWHFLYSRGESGGTWELRDYPDQWIVTYPSIYKRLYPKIPIVFQHPILTPERYGQIRKGLQTFRFEAPRKVGTIRLPKIETATGRKHK